jgi:hypothetical protein
MGLDPTQWVRLTPSAPKWRDALPRCCDAAGRCTMLELACSHFDLQVRFLCFSASVIIRSEVSMLASEPSPAWWSPATCQSC